MAHTSNKCETIKTRISRASLSMSFSVRSRSACMMFRAMTTPRCRKSWLSLSKRACRISSQWLVYKLKRKKKIIAFSLAWSIKN
uniref:Uncharacterized protein n=1 Tax=Denticeps clupeoides TaxID=299321 RepID=A0AAY4BGR0_9TELE